MTSVTRQLINSLIQPTHRDLDFALGASASDSVHVRVHVVPLGEGQLYGKHLPQPFMAVQ